MGEMENKLHKNSYPAVKGAGNPSGGRPLKSILKKTPYTPHATMEASTDQHRTKGASGVENAPNAPHIGATSNILMKAVGIEPDPNIGVNDKSGNGMFNVGCDAGTKPDISHKAENFDMVLPKSAIDKVKNRFENSLVGYFVGKSLAFPIVQNYVNNTWGKFGLQKLTRNDDGVFLFKFATSNGLEQVLKRGPWMIRNSPLIRNKWTPNVSLIKNEVTKVPAWIKLHKIPLVAYSEDGLSLIATQIGKPIMLDAFTSSMCNESWVKLVLPVLLLK
nr:hypothetical protein [Tanacetum cinerariifolium]